MSEEQFFHELLADTKEAYFKSDIYQKENAQHWYYSVCGTPIQKGKGILLGI